MSKGTKKIYLDYASTTPPSRESVSLFVSLSNNFSNPSSLYASGVEAKKRLEEARSIFARTMHCHEDEIIFTSGGTESNNLAIKGAIDFQRKKLTNSSKLHIVTSSIEHSSVLEVCKGLEGNNVEITYIPVDHRGLVDPKEIEKSIRRETVIVSIGMVNNEIGTLQPIREIAKAIRHARKKLNLGTRLPYFHTDACQAVVTTQINLETLGVDLLTLDSSKSYAPKGCGVLYKKRGVDLRPQLLGGGQEKGYRSGTENMPLASSFAFEFERLQKNATKEFNSLMKLKHKFLSELKKKIPEAKINGDHSAQSPHIINFCIPKLDSEFAVFCLDKEGVECSSASSCLNLKEDSYSYVVDQVSGEECRGSSLRISLGRETKWSDLSYCLKVLSRILLSQWTISINNK